MTTGYRPRRLRRTFDTIDTAHGFALYATGGAGIGLYEDSIHSVSIKHGGSSRGGGHTPSTCEVTVDGLYSAALNGAELRVFLRDSFAANLAAHLGPSANPDLFARRYTGRVGAMSVEDTGRRFSTTITASSWLTQMNYSPRTYAPTAGEDLTTVLLNLAAADEPNRGIDMIALNQTGITVRETADPVLWRDGLDTYGTEPGVSILERRDGHCLVAPISFRTAKALDLVDTSLPLTRSQAVAPARWEQHNERPGITVRYTAGASGGASTVTRTAEVANPTGELRETVDVDWSHLVMPAEVDNQLYREAYGRVFAATARLWRLPTIRVDLLHLIRSPHQYHRDQAAQILSMDPGDPVYLAGDWPTDVDGIHFADEITETITPDSWTIEMGMKPWAVVTGDTTQPPVAPRSWDSAGTAVWDNDTRTWQEAA